MMTSTAMRGLVSSPTGLTTDQPLPDGLPISARLHAQRPARRSRVLQAEKQHPGPSLSREPPRPISTRQAAAGTAAITSTSTLGQQPTSAKKFSPLRPSSPRNLQKGIVQSRQASILGTRAVPSAATGLRGGAPLRTPSTLAPPKKSSRPPNQQMLCNNSATNPPAFSPPASSATVRMTAPRILIQRDAPAATTSVLPPPSPVGQLEGNVSTEVPAHAESNSSAEYPAHSLTALPTSHFGTPNPSLQRVQAAPDLSNQKMSLAGPTLELDKALRNSAFHVAAFSFSEAVRTPSQPASFGTPSAGLQNLEVSFGKNGWTSAQHDFQLLGGEGKGKPPTVPSQATFTPSSRSVYTSQAPRPVFRMRTGADSVDGRQPRGIVSRDIVTTMTPAHKISSDASISVSTSTLNAMAPRNTARPPLPSIINSRAAIPTAPGSYLAFKQNQQQQMRESVDLTSAAGNSGGKQIPARMRTTGQLPTPLMMTSPLFRQAGVFLSLRSRLDRLNAIASLNDLTEISRVLDSRNFKSQLNEIEMRMDLLVDTMEKLLQETKMGLAPHKALKKVGKLPPPPAVSAVGRTEKEPPTSHPLARKGVSLSRERDGPASPPARTSSERRPSQSAALKEVIEGQRELIIQINANHLKLLDALKKRGSVSQLLIPSDRASRGDGSSHELKSVASWREVDPKVSQEVLQAESAPAPLVGENRTEDNNDTSPSQSPSTEEVIQLLRCLAELLLSLKTELQNVVEQTVCESGALRRELGQTLGSFFARVGSTDFQGSSIRENPVSPTLSGEGGLEAKNAGPSATPDRPASATEKVKSGGSAPASSAGLKESPKVDAPFLLSGGSLLSGDRSEYSSTSSGTSFSMRRDLPTPLTIDTPAPPSSACSALSSSRAAETSATETPPEKESSDDTTSSQLDEQSQDSS